MLILVQWLMYFDDHVYSVTNVEFCTILHCVEYEKEKITRKEERGFLSSMLLFASALQIAF